MGDIQKAYETIKYYWYSTLTLRGKGKRFSEGGIKRQPQSTFSPKSHHTMKSFARSTKV